jgi:type II secretory pathway pseudopilin PulG
MKILLFAAALSMSGVALAQSTTTTTTTQPSGETVDDPSQSTGPRGITQQGTDPNGMATMGSSPGAGNYPPCSRTVTDSCVQTYERGVRRSRPRR